MSIVDRGLFGFVALVHESMHRETIIKKKRELEEERRALWQWIVVVVVVLGGSDCPGLSLEWEPLSLEWEPCLSGFCFLSLFVITIHRFSSFSFSQ